MAAICGHFTPWRRAAACAASWALVAIHALAQQAPQVGFHGERVGPSPVDRPAVTHVQVVDLDGDERPEVVACDAQRQAVFAYDRQEDGTWTERAIAKGLIAPAHATVVDLDQDGDNDVVVSVMGNLYPDDAVIGSLILLERRGEQYVRRTLLDDVRRVVDAQPGDFDGDGDLDLAVAVFGYLRGQVLWLENRGEGQFLDHELHAAAGTIHVPVADYDGDGDLDIAAVVSQQDEEVWGFENLGGGKFGKRRLWMTINYDIGSAGLVATDLDGDKDVDLLLPVGDNLEDSYSTAQPYHGCLWLENRGQWEFAAARIGTFPGAYAAAAGDLDADGDQDVALVSMVNHWDDPAAPSLVWLENDGEQKFAQHAIAADPIMLVTVGCGDVNQDGKFDLVAGGLHMYPPYDRLGRISCWLGSDPLAANAAAAATESTAPSGDAAESIWPDNRPPLPDLNMIEPLARREVRALYDAIDAKAKNGGAGAADWLELGQVYYAFGFFAAAGRCFEESIERDAKSSLGHYLLGTSLARRGLLNDAVAQLRRTLPLASPQQQSWIWYDIGRCYLRLENAEAAEEAFIKSGQYVGSLWELARLRLRSGRAAESAPPLNELARVAPQATEMFLLNAQAAEALGDAAYARQSRDRAEYNEARLPSDPVTSIIHPISVRYGSARLLAEGKAMIDAERWDEAAKILSPVVAESDDDDALVLLAGAELKRGRPEKTIQLLSGQIRRRGAMPVSLLLLGDAFAAAGKPDQALTTWELTARFRSSPDVHERLAKHYEQAGRGEDARRQRALVQQASGITQLRHAKPAAAKTAFDAAVGLDPSPAMSWFYLGECRRLLGDVGAAREAYHKALERAPNHGRARAALALLEQ